MARENKRAVAAAETARLHAGVAAKKQAALDRPAAGGDLVNCDPGKKIGVHSTLNPKP